MKTPKQRVKTKNIKKKTAKKKDLFFEDKEQQILKEAIEQAKLKQGKKLMDDDTIKIIDIVESFLKDKKCVCYGGTAINNILPEEAQFYDKRTDFPD